MNEKIKGLKKQAIWEVTKAHGFTSNNVKHFTDNKDECVRAEVDAKFAELIILECAKVAVFKDAGLIATADVAGYMAAGREMAARMIKEHFGVK